MSRWLILLALFSMGTAIAWSFQAVEPPRPGKLSPTEQVALQPGLTLRLFAPQQRAQALDARRLRLAALHVPAGSAPSPFVAAGPFHARLTGYLKNPLKGLYSFRLKGTGAIVLRINGKIVLENPDAARAGDKEAEVELFKNYNRLEIDYVSPARGDATLRLYWSTDKFGFEPVPPEVLFARGDEEDLAAKTELREGRLLYADLHCAACHGMPGKATLASAKMPELQKKPPRLDEAGHRFQGDWLAAWILDPRKLRPEAAMPSVLRGPEAEQKAADIAAYLVTLKKEAAPQPLGKASGAVTGEALFKKLGCNSCHRLNEPQAQDELARLTLFFVGAKYAPHALAHFLKEPHQRYPWIRMPDFHLSDDEAGHLEAYLREHALGKIDGMPAGDAPRGEKLFREVGCLHCHQIGAGKASDAAAVLKIQALERGCLGEKDKGQSPDFALNPTQQAALRALLQTDGSSLTRATAAEFSQRQVQLLQCASCHRRDAAVTRWHQVLEDEGKVPEALPSLTWTGEKLRPAWTKKLLAGQTDHTARPWIKARMPAFTARAEMLSLGLSHEHGFGVDEDDRPPPDAQLAEVGKKLIPQTGGFNCINCHGIGKQPPLQPFEAPGINLVDAALRLRHEYYQRWMLDPARVDVTMRMPVFAMDGKTTPIREVFDGDARRQFEAIWHYIQTLPQTQK